MALGSYQLHHLPATTLEDSGEIVTVPYIWVGMGKQLNCFCIGKAVSCLSLVPCLTALLVDPSCFACISHISPSLFGHLLPASWVLGRSTETETGMESVLIYVR